MLVRKCKLACGLISTAISLLLAIAAVERACAAGTQLPVIHRFVASRSEISAGEPVTLSWSVTGSTSIRLSGITSTPSSPVTVYPDASTTYTLTATNASGSVHAQASVTVQSGEAIVPAASVEVDSPGLEVPPTFMGLGIGGTSYAGVMGAPATGTNPIYRKLLKNLTAYGSGPIVIKITGDTDTVPSAYDVSVLAQLNKDIGAQFYVGLNLKSDSTDLAVQQADAFTSGMPPGSIVAAEIGNEPDLYVEQGYRSSYTAAEFLANYAEFRSAVLPTLERVHAKLAAPAWSDSSSLANLAAFLAQEHANLAVVTQHAYGGNKCGGAVFPPDYLLSEEAQTRGAASIVGGVAPSQRYRLPFRCGESNSINCSGQSGVSNTFQAALWVMDWMARMAADGIAGINLFGDTQRQAYTLFTFNTATSADGMKSYSIDTINPEYYGLVMFQQATQNSARFLPIQYGTSANVKAYAWIDGKKVIRILVLNKDEQAQGTVAISIPGHGEASLTRLIASSYAAASGVSLAGMTLDGSTDGSFHGTEFGETISPADGAYRFAMPVTSAALLTIVR